MSDVVGSANVEIRGDLSKLPGDVEKGFDDAFTKVASDADTAANRIESAFTGAAAKAETELQGINGLERVESDARSAASGIESAMTRAASDIESEFDQAADDIEQSLEGAGDSAGDGFSGGFSAKALAGIVAFGSAAGELLSKAFEVAGETIGAAFSGAMEQARLPQLIEAQLDVPPEFARGLAEEASSVYRDAWGESLGEVSDMLVVAQSTIGQFGEFTTSELGDAVEMAYQMADVFGIDVSQAIEQAGRLVQTGLAENGTEALSLLTAGLQRVPATIRDELFEATNEYGQFFAAIGLSGEEAIGLLVQASEDGVFGLDKMGDAIKEFTIRSTDMSTASGAAYEAIGLDANEMANKLLAGGDTANEAFDQIVNGLLDIEDPAARANAAIALFGTPLEDLGVNEIPAFLESLISTEDALGDFENSGQQLADATNTWQSSFESFKRNALGGLSDLIQNYVLPVLQSFGAWWNENLPAIQAVWEQVTGAIVAFWNENGAPLFESIGETVTAVVELISVVWDTFGALIMERVRIVFEYIFNTIQNVMTVIQGIINVVLGLISGDWSRVWEGIQQIFSGVWAQIQNVITTALALLRNTIQIALTAVGAIFGNAWNAIITALGGFVTRIGGVITGLASSVKSWFTSMWNTAYTTVSGWLTNIVTLVTGLPGRIVTALSSLASTVGGIFTGAWTTVQTAVGTLLQNVIDYIGGLPGRISSALVNMGSELISGIGSAFRSAWNAVIDAAPSFHVRIDPPGPGVLFDETISLSFLRLANGGIFPAKPGGYFANIAEAGGDEVVAPLDRPRRAVELADQSGLTDMVLAAHGGRSGPSYGSLVSFPGATIQDATDAELVAQKVLTAQLVLAGGDS